MELNFDFPPVYRNFNGGLYEYTILFLIDGEDIFCTLPKNTWNKGVIISAIIRCKYSVDKVEAIINNILSNPFDLDKMLEYKSLQEWRTTAKLCAERLMKWASENNLDNIEGIPQEDEETLDSDIIEVKPDGLLLLALALSFVKTQVTDLPDEKAIEVSALFPTWYDKIGQQVNVDDRLYYNNRLWKVLLQHTIQENWTPDITPSLYTEIVILQEGEPEIGTLENPIPYNGNMELFEGKYYSQDGVIYLCIRDSGNPVYHPLSALVGLYVLIVS